MLHCWENYRVRTVHSDRNQTLMPSKTPSQKATWNCNEFDYCVIVSWLFKQKLLTMFRKKKLSIQFATSNIRIFVLPQLHLLIIHNTNNATSENSYTCWYTGDLYIFALQSLQPLVLITIIFKKFKSIITPQCTILYETILDVFFLNNLLNYVEINLHYRHCNLWFS